jgi:serine/threonine protein kinase
VLADTRTFLLLDRLGKGGFGEVWRARMERQGFAVEVAVKLLHDGIDPRGDAARRLRDEAKLLGMLRHKAIPLVLDLVELDGRMALVSELVDGADFDTCLRPPDPIGVRAGCLAIADIADALDAAWSAPILRAGEAAPLRLVHRDVKPSNLRIGRDGQARLLDFGIAWTTAITRDAETRAGAVVGSPLYMAPERFDPSEPQPAADIYGLGCVLYELGARQRLWRGVSPRTMNLLMLLQERYDRALGPRLNELPRDLDPTLRELITACLQHDPAARPSARALSDTLSDLADRLDGPTLTAWCRQHPWPARTEQGFTPRALVEGPSSAEPTASTARSLVPVPGMNTPHQTTSEPWRTGVTPTAPETAPVTAPLTAPPTGPLTPPTPPRGRWLAAAALVGGLAWGASTLLPGAPVAGPTGNADAPAATTGPEHAPPTGGTTPGGSTPAGGAEPGLTTTEGSTTTSGGSATTNGGSAPQPSPPKPPPDKPTPPQPQPAPPQPTPVVAEVVVPTPPPPPKTASIRAKGGDVSPFLRCGDVRHTLPATVPPGSCTILVEETPGVEKHWGTLQAKAGETITLSCANRMCKATRDMEAR